MKRILMIPAVAGLTWFAHSQGTVIFDNIYGGGPNAPVYESDGATKLSGPQFMAELLGGPSASSLDPIATTSFLTGSQAGYFLGGEQTINTVVSGATAWVAVEVWNTDSGGSFAQAKASGLPNSWWESSVFSVQTQQFNGIPLPVPLTGLGTSPVYLNGVPEPSALTLAGLGMASIIIAFKWPRKATEKPVSFGDSDAGASPHSSQYGQ